MTAVLLDILVVRAKGLYQFDPKDTGTGLMQVDLSVVTGFNNNVTASCVDPVTDTLYFVYAPDKLATWNTDTDSLQYTWKSKVYQLPYAAVFEAAQVKGSGFGAGVTFKLYADGTLYYTKVVTVDGEFVIPPPPFGAKEWQVEVIGTATITWLEASEDMMELR